MRKKNLSVFFGIFLTSMLFVPQSMPFSEAQEDYTIPAWIKNNAGWWADGQIDDNAFTSGLQWLISNKIMMIPATEQEAGSGSVIPSWIKNNAGWWADGQIDDTSFVQSIQFLIENRIIKIDQKFDENLINFAVVGDLAVTSNVRKNLKNIEKVNPEIILIVGDIRNDDGPPAGWFEMTEFLGEDRIRVAIGNHDFRYQDQYLMHYDLPREFYSFDFGNVHFIVLATETTLSINSDQFQFLLTDLQYAKNNPDVDWIIVGLHKPIYTDGQFVHVRDSANLIDLEHMIMWRTMLQPLFDYYNVDLVLQGHNHFYERLKPLRFDGIITDNNSSNYVDPQGQIYVTLGTGGHFLSPNTIKSNLSVIQTDQFYGFLNLKLTPDGKTLNGEFITLDEEVIDKFQIKKQKFKHTSNFEIPNHTLSGMDLSNQNLVLYDFSNADLSYTDLRNADLTYADLSNTNLTGSDLRGINLHGTNLSGVDLSGTDLTGANLSFQNLSLMDLSSITLDNTTLYYTNLTGTNLSGKNLSGLNIKHSILKFVNFEYTDLSFAYFTNSKILTSKFSHTNLENAHLNDSYVIAADFSNSNISGVNFHHAVIVNGDFRDTELNNVDFSNARITNSIFDSQDLRYVNITNADFSAKWLYEIYFKATSLVNADLSNRDLSSVIFAREFTDRLDLLSSIDRQVWLENSVNLSGANLSGANLSGKNISQVNNLVGVTFFEANLSNADLSGSDILFADLSFADLSNSNLENANLSGANLANADLRNANLTDTDLKDAILDGVKLDGAILKCKNHSVCENN